jgi:hypothetical protein
MTRAEFIDAYHPGPGDDVEECHCGASDCPDWKIVNREQQRREVEALERLPQVLAEAARRAGDQAAKERNAAIFREILGPDFVERRDVGIARGQGASPGYGEGRHGEGDGDD